MDEASYTAGYNAARTELRMLLNKVDWSREYGVTRAWLYEPEGEDDGSERSLLEGS